LPKAPKDTVGILLWQTIGKSPNDPFSLAIRRGKMCSGAEGCGFKPRPAYQQKAQKKRDLQGFSTKLNERACQDLLQQLMPLAKVWQIRANSGKSGKGGFVG
jgi:hypothetical protein